MPASALLDSALILDPLWMLDCMVAIGCMLEEQAVWGHELRDTCCSLRSVVMAGKGEGLLLQVGICTKTSMMNLFNLKYLGNLVTIF